MRLSVGTFIVRDFLLWLSCVFTVDILTDPLFGVKLLILSLAASLGRGTVSIAVAFMGTWSFEMNSDSLALRLSKTSTAELSKLFECMLELSYEA